MDLSFFKKSKNTFIFLFFFSIIGITVFIFINTTEKRLPVLSPKDINPKLVDSSLQGKSKNHKIGEFKLINQNGEIITNKDYENKIYVADFFFTSCQTICITMTSNMELLQNHFKTDDDVLFLSHSVTPEQDSVPVLRAYADRKGAIDGKWNLVTGTKKHIYELARKSYFAVLDEGDGGIQDFIHTQNFVLIDKKFQIRGIYDGTKSEDIERIKTDIEMLKKEDKD